MTAADLMLAAQARGLLLSANSGKLVIGGPNAAIDEMLGELSRRKADVLAIIHEREAPSADRHAYVVPRWIDRDAEQYGVCIACGCPWEMHGRPTFETFQVVDDPDAVELVRAQPVVAARSIVVAELAADIGLSHGGRLCSRCAKIGRDDARGVCTFCLAGDRE